MKKTKIIFCVAIFAFAMMANIQYALDGYGVSKCTLRNEVLAQGTGGTSSGGTGNVTGSGSSWWDRTDFFASMATDPIYNYNANLAVGVKGFSIKIGDVHVGFIGILKHCVDNHWYNTCDLSKETFAKDPGYTT